MKDINGKVAYITGGSSGIGKGIAKELLRQGMKVAITSRSQETADKIALELGNEENVIGIGSDVSSLQNEKYAISKAVEKFGSIDVVIANAGVGHFASIDDITEEQWRETIDTNLTGVFNTTKASVEELEKSKGYLITISSLAGTNFFEKGGAYNASKFGVVGFTQAVMLDLRKKDIKTTTIMPGSVATHFNGNEPSSDDAWKIQPEDLGQMVVDLLYMNERTLPSKVEVRPSFPHKK